MMPVNFLNQRKLTHLRTSRKTNMKTDEELYYYCKNNGIVQQWLSNQYKYAYEKLKPYIRNPIGDLMATKIDSRSLFTYFQNIITFQCHVQSTTVIMSTVLDLLFCDIADCIPAGNLAVFFRMNKNDYQAGLGLCIPEMKDIIENTIIGVGVDTLIRRIQSGYYSQL